MADAVSLMKPPAFIFENVVGFANSVCGEEAPLKEFIRKLDGCYFVRTITLALSDWVSVDRKRLGHGFNVLSVSLTLPSTKPWAP